MSPVGAWLLTQFGVLGQAASLPALTPKLSGRLPENENRGLLAIRISAVGAVDDGAVKPVAGIAVTNGRAEAGAAPNQHNPLRTNATKNSHLDLTLGLKLDLTVDWPDFSMN